VATRHAAAADAYIPPARRLPLPYCIRDADISTCCPRTVRSRLRLHAVFGCCSARRSGQERDDLAGGLPRAGGAGSRTRAAKGIAPRWRTIEIRNEGELNLAHVTVTWTFLVGGAFVLVGVVRRRFGCHK